ncbi:hypothetical protein E4U42_007615, partial [Claviceps africana]
AQATRLGGLLAAYHHTEADTHAPSRKVKRRARRQVGFLRAQIRLAAEQQTEMHLRLSDLLLEARSRAALDLVPRRDGPAVDNQRADSGVGVFPEGRDEHEDDARRGAPGFLAGRVDVLALRRQTSMPDMRTSFPG